MKKRKIAVVITARPSYSRIRSALKAIEENDALELCLIIAGSALLNRYGSAVNYIERDGFTINAKVFNVLEGGSLIAQAKTTGLGIIELTNVFINEQPDAVITIADRYETIATAIAASYLNIPLIHIQGGEVTGNIDEKVRHAITKLSDLHFVSTELAFERVVKLGEHPEKVFLTGCPSIDIANDLMNNGSFEFDPYSKYGGVGFKPDYRHGYLVVMQHPVTTEYEEAKAQAKITLNAIKESGIPTFWFWPNVDAGTDGTSNAIRSFRENNIAKNIHFFKNMEPEDFLKLIYNSKCLIGNSSTGIREASYLGVPTVNIGTRQQGRERGPNVLDVDYNKSEILSAISHQMNSKKYESCHLYGDGNAGPKIAELLAKIPLTFRKMLNY